MRRISKSALARYERALHAFVDRHIVPVVITAGVFSVLVGAYLALLFLYIPVQNISEDISFALWPSGEKAYAYGELHFNGEDPSEYDVNRAMNYFQDAEQLDPSLPYVHHEIARIYFLNGDFGDAITQIDVQIAQEGSGTPNSYYVRGLIEGYMGDYTDAAADYKHFLQFDPHDWAGINDYSWILLKAGDAQQAELATAQGLQYYPENPWLLNTNATALYEMGDYKDAQVRAQEAWSALQTLTEADWLDAYPGNNPDIAEDGIVSFRAAVQQNLHTIQVALASSTAQTKAPQQ